MILVNSYHGKLIRIIYNNQVILLLIKYLTVINWMMVQEKRKWVTYCRIKMEKTLFSFNGVHILQMSMDDLLHTIG